MRRRQPIQRVARYATSGSQWWRVASAAAAATTIASLRSAFVGMGGRRDGYEVEEHRAVEAEEAAVRRGAHEHLDVEEVGERIGALRHHGAPRGARHEVVVAVRAPQPRGAHAAKREVRVPDVDDDVVDKNGAARHRVEHRALVRGVAGKDVERERVGHPFGDRDGVVGRFDGEHGEHGAEDLLLHQRRVEARVEDDRRRDVPCRGVDAAAEDDGAAVALEKAADALDRRRVDYPAVVGVRLRVVAVLKPRLALEFVAERADELLRA